VGKKYTIEYVREYIEKEDYFLLSDEYTNCMNKVRAIWIQGNLYLGK